jgi:flagellar protein FliS
MTSYGQMQYRRTQVITVDKGRLIVLLYEGAIKFIRQAQEFAECGDIPSKSNAINSALDIVAELNYSLNMSAGSEIAANLTKLYQFVSDRLLEGKIQKDTRSLDQALQILSSLNEAWKEVVRRPEAQAALSEKENATLLQASIKI